MRFVLFHANCSDGAASKYAAWRKFGNDATYLPVNYNKPMPEMPGATEVYILDFSYKREEIIALKERVGHLVVLDHHKTAKEELAGLDYCIFDMDRSGAMLAWQYFHPDEPVPDLVKLVQDRDLWLFNDDRTRPFNLGFKSMMTDMKAYDEHVRYKDVLHNTVERGKAMQEYNDALVAESLKSAVVKEVTTVAGKHRVAIVNATNLISDLGEAMYKSEQLNVAYSMSYFIRGDGSAVLSFRSGNGIDVSAIAKSLGGGGHKDAAGAPVDAIWFIRNVIMRDEPMLVPMSMTM